MLSWVVANAVADVDGVVAWCDALFVWSAAEEPEEEFHSVYETDARRVLI